MKYIFFFLLLITLNTNAQVLHEFVFCQTEDSKIGKSCEMNFFKVLSFCNEIADALNIKPVDHSIRSRQFYFKNVDSMIKKTVINKEDIVILYINTHGTKTKWELNIFPLLNVPKSLIESYSIYNYLLLKKPRCLIMILESCSGYSELSPQNAFIRMQTQSTESFQVDSIKDKSKEINIRKLFQLPRYLIVSAGQPGKNTWATDLGSTFTNCFLESFNKTTDLNVGDSNISWNFLLNQTKEMTYARTLVTNLQYYPVWEISDCPEKCKRNVICSKPKINNKLILDVRLASKIESFKHLNNKKYYYVTLRLANVLGIRQVTFFLGKTMKDSIITLRNSAINLKRKFEYKMPPIHNQFQIRANILLNDGSFNDLYEEIRFPLKINSR